MMYKTQFRKADAFFAKKAPFSALVSLGAILAALSHVPTYHMRQDLLAQVRSRLMDNDLSDVRRLAVAHCDRLARLLRYGSRFEYEELALALTLRVELALVRFCLNEIFQKDGTEGVAVCDERLLEIRESPENRAAYYSALRSIQKNWCAEIPFDLDALGIGHLAEM